MNLVPVMTNADFGTALDALKRGSCVSRAGWNGRGMFAYHVPANSYPAQTGAAKAFFGKDAMVPYGAYFALKTAENIVNTWVPSISDILTDDWIVLSLQEKTA